jgi:hypothetical protein
VIEQNVVIRLPEQSYIGLIYLRFTTVLQEVQSLPQVCLGILLNSVEENGLSPLVEYSAKHWVTHARSGRVSSCLRKAIEYCMHGFQDLTKRLVNKNPKSLNKRGGFWGTPLVATLATASSNSQASPSPRWWCRRECPWL